MEVFMLRHLFCALIFLSLVSCGTGEEKEGRGDFAGSRTLDSTATTADTGIASIWGYRFSIEGDFDGDGFRDTLTERYVSGIDGKETNKFYDTDNYDTVVAMTMAKRPRSFAVSGNPDIDTLPIADHPQLFGLAFLKNEGDLDGNGTDEISYVVNHADWSSINSCNVVTWTPEGWKSLLTFGIHDWELPTLPEFAVSYGHFGADRAGTFVDNDALNTSLEQELRRFGLIEKVRDGVVLVNTYAEEDTDSISIGEPVRLVVPLTKVANAEPHVAR